MDRLIVNVVLHEEVIDTAQEGHLWQGEYVHELLHGVPMRTLQDKNSHCHIVLRVCTFRVIHI